MERSIYTPNGTSEFEKRPNRLIDMSLVITTGRPRPTAIDRFLGAIQAFFCVQDHEPSGVFGLLRFRTKCESNTAVRHPRRHRRRGAGRS